MKGAIRNDLDWFLAFICVRNEAADCSSKDAAARNVTWVNAHLIQAKDLSEAFDKAVKIGRLERGKYKGKDGMRKWRFVGLWDLLPIWDDLADGEEMFWTDYGRMTARAARRRCITKQQLLRDFLGSKRATKVANKSRQPTPRERLDFDRRPSARRGCARRSTSGRA